MTHHSQESHSSPTGARRKTLFTACGDRTRPEPIALVSPANPSRLHTEGWISHPDGDLLLFAPPGGDEFFGLIDAAIQRAPGVFMQRHLSVDELCTELTREELSGLADWLRQLIDTADDENSLIVRWATDLRVQIVVWLEFRERPAGETPQRDAASERVQ